MAWNGMEQIVKGHGEILRKYDERLKVLESSSVLEAKRLDGLCRQLAEFSHDIKNMLKSHEERILEYELDGVKKEKDLENLVNSVQGILSIIKWTGSTVFLLLAGFFIWYVQNVRP